MSKRQKPIVLEKGKSLFTKGDIFNGMVYLVEDGVLEVYNVSDEKLTLIGHVQPGEFVGEMSLMDGQPRSATVIAKFPSQLLPINLQDYQDCIAKWPKWYQALMKTLLDRLRLANESVRV